MNDASVNDASAEASAHGLLARLAGHRARFNQAFEAYFDALPGTFDAPAASRFAPRSLELLRDQSLRGGKRLRPAVLFEAAGLVTAGRPPGLIEAALSIELLHTVGLVHDDIIDEGTVRHGGPSVLQSYREEFPGRPHTALGLALLAGDLALFLSMRVLLEADVTAELRQAMLRVHTAAGADGVVGQFLDLERDFGPLPGEALLDTVTEYKSTRYSVLAPLRMGLLVAGEDPAPHDDRLRRYATLVGVYEQMRDDYLDVFGDEERVGKSPGSDIRDGRRTYAVRALLEAAKGPERTVVESVLGRPDLTPDDLRRLREVAVSLGVDAALRARMRRYAEDAAAEAAGWSSIWRADAVDFFARLPLWNVERDR